MTDVDVLHHVDVAAASGVEVVSAAFIDRGADTVSPARKAAAGARTIVRRPGLTLAVVWVALIAVAALAPRLLTSRLPLQTETRAKLLGPSRDHLFGTDQLGRDMFSRVVHGTSLSLQAALVAVGIGLAVGVTIGLVAGFARGVVDDVLMRFVDVLLAIPSLMLSLSLITVLGFGTLNVGLAVGFANIAACARIMRSEVLRVRQSTFVEAAHSGGARWSRVLLRHVLPNSIGPVLVLAAMQFGIAILTVSSLSFLGYGTQPPTPEWGSLVATGRDFLRDAWWLTTMPGLVVAATVLAANRISGALDAAVSLMAELHADPTAPLLRVEDLSVSYRHRRGQVDAVRHVALTLSAGETLALVGESGSGKSTTAHAIAGLLAPAAEVTGGRIVFDGIDLLRAKPQVLRALRGIDIGVIPQDPTVSLNPVQRIGDQVAEVFRIHGLADRRGAKAAAIEALERSGLTADRARQYPHELSGGMRQRVLIAIALAARPKLVVADEPTSALDVTVQRRILDHLGELTAEVGSAVLLITHDLGIAAERADRVAVMSRGRIVEVGGAGQILGDPQDEYTKTLIAAAPSLGATRRTVLARVGSELPRSVAGVAGDPFAAARPAGVPLVSDDLVVATGLIKEFALAGGTLRAVDDVSLRVPRARTLALVGESGSGKSTTARLLLRLTDPTSGRIEFDGTDVTALRGRSLRALRRRMQLVYQNPFASLNPRLDVADVIADPLRSFGLGSRDARQRRAAELVDRVALPSSVLRRKPGELSGGQRQRVAIARALALNPDLVVCDEPVSALDVSVQAQILELLVELQRDLGVTYVFISHDLAVVREIAHDVAVMRDGVLVEHGPTERVLTHPEHPYTRDLLAAIPGEHPHRSPHLTLENT